MIQLDRLREFGLEAIEQPCAHWDLQGNALVTQQLPIPVIADEGFWTPHDAQVFLSAGAADVLHVYLGKCGGIFQSLRIAAVAHASGKNLTIGERPPLGIAEAAHAHFAAALPHDDYPAALAYDLNADDLLTSPIRKECGGMWVPEGPGLGIEVDEDKLAFWTRRDV